MSEWIRKPEIVVFAGPNGSGKSTFTALLKPAMDYINADEIKKNLKCSDYEAAELAQRQRENHLRKGKPPVLIAYELEEDYGTVSDICKIAEKFAPDYDSDSVCREYFILNNENNCHA